MIQDPLFQNNILSTLYKYFSYYLSYENWGWQFLFVLVALYILYKLITYKNTVLYPNFVPNKKYTFSWKTDKIFLFFLLICLSLYIINLYSQELSFFSNYDTMSYSTMLTLERGVTPILGFGDRFNPISLWELNIFYAITHNLTTINLFIILQVIIIIILIYKLFDFTPVFLRLIGISLFLISPSFFWLNNVVYPERMLFIYILSSLLFIKKYTQTRNNKMLWIGILFLNFALYTKETTPLLFVGILIYSFINNLLNNKITIKSFIHPINTLKAFPLEFLIFFSLLIYAIFFAIYVSEISTGKYVSLCKKDLSHILSIYKIECSIIFVSLLIWITESIKKKPYSFLENGLLIGSYIFSGIVLFVLRLQANEQYAAIKTYFIAIPFFFCLLHIINRIKRQKFLLIFITISTCLFTLANYQILKQENGKYFRETAEFINTQTSKELSIFIAPNSEDLPWNTLCYAAAYKHYFPSQKITFHSNIYDLNNLTHLLFLHWVKKYPSIFHPTTKQEKPQIGDLYVIKKTNKYNDDKALINDLPNKMIYQNNLFEIYEIK